METAFRSSVAFLDKVVFRSDVEIQGHVIVSDDTAGQVIVPAGLRNIRVEFRKPYDVEPIIMLTPVGMHDVRYAVDMVDKDGFVILIDEAQLENLTFNWMAVEMRPHAAPN